MLTLLHDYTGNAMFCHQTSSVTNEAINEIIEREKTMIKLTFCSIQERQLADSMTAPIDQPVQATQQKHQKSQL